MSRSTESPRVASTVRSRRSPKDLFYVLLTTFVSVIALIWGLTVVGGLGETVKVPGASPSQYSESPPRPHPHAGALDKKGHWGYVHDPTVLRQNPFPLKIPYQLSKRRNLCAAPGKGQEKPMGNKVLQKISVALETPEATDGNGTRVKVFCAIYTYEGNADQVDAVLETWGPKCDGFMAATTITERQKAKVHIPSYGSLPEGSYDSIWQKVRSMMAYMHDNFLDEYDYFHLSGDDTFLIPENLRLFLGSERVRTETAAGTPMYIGGWLWPWWDTKRRLEPDFYYNGGGPGYTINRAALSKLVNEGFPTICDPELEEAWEDFRVGICFWKLGIRPFDARDSLGAFRYHHFTPAVTVSYFQNPILWGRFYSKQVNWMKRVMDIPKKTGMSIVSNESVAFHRIDTPDFMRRVYILLYKKDPKSCCGPNEK